MAKQVNIRRGMAIDALYEVTIDLSKWLGLHGMGYNQGPRASMHTYIWNITSIHIHSYAPIYIHMYALLMNIHDVMILNTNLVVATWKTQEEIIKARRLVLKCHRRLGKP